MRARVSSLMFSCPRDVGLIAVARRQLAGQGTDGDGDDVNDNDTNTHTRLMALFQDYLVKPVPER